MVGVFLATAARLAIAPYVGDQFIFPMYILAVLLTGWYCGLGPAVLSLVLGIATASLLILPEGSFGDKGLVSTLLGLGLFIAVGAVGIAVSEDHRKVQRRLLDEIDRRSEAERTLREHAGLSDQAPVLVRDLNEWYGTSPDIDDQKRAGERLRTEKERLRLALAAGRMSTWSLDLDTDLLSWKSGLEANEEGCDFEGTFGAFRALAHPEDRQRIDTTIRNAIDQGGEFELEFRTLHPGRSVNWLCWRGRVVADASGRAAQLIGVGMDITPRKEAEIRVAALRADLERRVSELEVLLALLPVGVAIAEDPLCKRIRANKNLLAILGATPADNISLTATKEERPDWRVFSEGRELGPEDLPLQRCAGKGIEIRDEVVDIVFADGRSAHLLVSANPLRDETGQPKGCVGVLIDITEHRRSEQVSRFLADTSRYLAEIREPHATLHQVARLAVPFFADGCFIDLKMDNTTLRRVAACPARHDEETLTAGLTKGLLSAGSQRPLIQRVVQTGHAELIAELTEQHIAELDRDAANQELIRGMNPRSLICVPLVVRNHVLGAMTFLLSSPGRLYGPADLGRALDLAGRTAIAVENARLYQELIESDHRKTEFLAMLAHELRNPLVPISNAVHLLRHPAGPDEMDQDDLLEMMERQIETVTRLVEDLMDVTRISRGKIELRKQPIDLRQIVDRAVGSVRASIEERRHHLVVQFPADPLRLEADPTRLEQILWNLLSNAVKYTDPGGRICLSAERSDGELIVRVRDNGVGIPPEMLPSIFGLFTQIEHRRDRAQGGLGIGLNLVRNLIELHGGSIVATSEGEGKGSEFTVRLPGLPPSTPPPARRNSRATTPEMPSRRRILVVDDNIDAAKSLARVLTLLFGQDVRVAHDGPSALETADTFEPEIAFLDIGLPDMSGLEVGMALRERPRCSHCLLAAVTGWGQDKDRERSRAAGFDFHLVKPVRPDALRDILTGKVTSRRA